MVEHTETSTDRTSTASSKTHKAAWRQTIEEMDAIAEQLEAEGWDVVAFPAGHTGPEAPDHGHDETRFGLTHVIPGNKVEPFLEAYESGSFEDYQVFQNEVAGRVFIVTVLEDQPTESAIIIAGSYEKRNARGLTRAAVEADAMYTHVRRLDGTDIGTFEHEDYRHFFPEADHPSSERE